MERKSSLAREWIPGNQDIRTLPVLLIAHPFHAEAALELGQPKIRAARKSASSRWGVRGTGLEGEAQQELEIICIPCVTQ